VGLYVIGPVIVGLFVELYRFLLHLVGLSENFEEISLYSRGELPHHHSLHHFSYTFSQLFHGFVLEVGLS
jgi:hypothetical protein